MRRTRLLGAAVALILVASCSSGESIVSDGDDKDTWWSRATEVWPAYDDYQASTDRRIPLVLLEES